MRFTEYKGRIRKKANVTKLIDDFHNSGMQVAKLEDWEYVTAISGAGTINRAAKREGIRTIKAITRNGEIFLVRQDV